MKTFSILMILSVIILITGCNARNIKYVEIGDKKISVEVADTPEERGEGLMFREELCEGCGMLFIMEEEIIPRFWMKNTLIPLDMIFISSNLEVVDILRAEPCEEDPCKVYSPKEKALYVLEVNKGTFDEGVIGKKAEISG